MNRLWNNKASIKIHGCMRIALVEDEKKLAETIKTGLQAEGYHVDIFFDGLQAEMTFAENAAVYDLFIFDLALPQLTGLEICQTLRKAGNTAPILILTARNHLEDKISLLDAGADDFMTKPFDFEEFLARLRALLRRPRQALPVQLAVADLTLAPNRREVTRAGHKISLTIKEFQLLYYLLRNANRVISRGELFEHVWALDPLSDSNVVDVHIKNLREKIDEGYGRKLIETIRGIGYAIKTEASQ